MARILILLITLGLGACAENKFTTPPSVALPVRSYLYVDDVGPECTHERIRDLRWRADKSLEICSGTGWQQIRVLGTAGWQ